MKWIEPIRLRQIWRPAAWAAGLAVVLGLAFLIYPIGEPLRSLSYDLPLILRGTSATRVDDVVIVYMDNDSALALHQTRGTAWDPREHTKLLKVLQNGKAKAVVFDVLFSEMDSNNAVHYQQLAEQMKRSGNVVVAASYEPPSAKGSVLIAKPVELPVPPIAAVAPWGIVEFPKETDGVPRRQRFFRVGKPPVIWKNLAWTAAELTGQAPSSESGATRWLNYYGPAGTISSVSYHEAVLGTNLLPADRFAGKVVFVGKKPMISTEGPTKAADELPTPFSRWGGPMPGVEIQATAFLNLIKGDWINEASQPAEMIIFAFTAVLFGFGFLVFRPWIAAAIALLCFICLTSLALYLVWQRHLWFPWMIVGTVQIPVALAWAVLVNTRNVYHEKQLLEQTLATARAASAQAGSNTGSGPVAALNAINQAAAAPGSEGPTILTPTGATLEQGIIGDHELVRPIGSGAYGEVWLGKSLVGMYRAVKVVYRKKFQHAAPFEREFRGLKKFAPVSMSHRGFVHILHVGKNDNEGYFYYVMELGDDEVRGPEIDPNTYSAKNLGKELKKRGSLPLAECLTIGIELSGALEHLHDQELIHRDIKPSNIIFVKGAPKLADIGLVTAMEPDRTDVTYVGTPGYIAPEGPGSRVADIFSLGKVLYECAMGRDCQHYPELPSSLLERSEKDELLELNNVISKACDPDPRCRYATALELHSDLLKLQQRLESATGVPDAHR